MDGGTDGSTMSSDADSSPPTRSQAHSEGDRLEELTRLLSGPDTDELAFSTAVVAIFDIKCPEMEVYLTLLDYPESTPNELTDILDRGRSNIGSRLRSLCEKGLVTRKQRVDATTGPKYEYTAQPLDETANWMIEEIDRWSAEVSDQVATFREEWPNRDRQEFESG